METPNAPCVPSKSLSGPQRAPRLRSRVTNGATYLTLRDSGSPSARRLRDLMAALTADLGGVDVCSTAELMLIRRAAMLSLQLELMEQQWASRRGGEAPAKPLINYQRVTNTLRRTLEALGLRRRLKPVEDLDSYLAVAYGEDNAPK
jgi:hypothetical protein